MQLYELQEAGATMRVMPLPVSSTGKRAWISLQSIRTIAKIRSFGVPFIMLSGARTSTIFERLPWLPMPDAVATENGGARYFSQCYWYCSWVGGVCEILRGMNSTCTQRAKPLMPEWRRLRSVNK